MRLHKTLIATFGTALALSVITGCSNGQDDKAGPESTPSATATDGAYVAPKKTVVCDDGLAKVTDSNADVSINGDCATVEVAANNSKVTVTGSVEKLTVSGAINAVTAKTIASVAITDGSNGNIVSSSNEPTVDDKGEQNDINK